MPGPNLSLKMLIDADGKTAVREINGTAAAVSGLGTAAGETASLLGTMGTRLVGLAAGGFVLSELVTTLGTWTRASGDATRAAAMLDAAIRRQPGGTQAQADALKELAQATQAQTGVDGDALVQQQARLAGFRLTAEQIALLTPHLVDAAEGARVFGAEETDLAGITRALGRAQTDNVAILKRFGVALSDTEAKQIDAMDGMTKTRAIAALLERQFGGLAAAAGKTWEGAARIAAEASGDLAESLGDLITKSPEAIDGLTGYTAALRSATDFVSAHAGAIREVAGDAGLLAMVAALGMAAKRAETWIATQRESIATSKDQAAASATEAANLQATTAKKELSARANQTLAMAAAQAAKAEHALLSAQLLQDPELATNTEFMRRLEAARKAAAKATDQLRAADLALTGALGASGVAAEKAAAAAQAQAGGWREVASMGGALNAVLAGMIGYDIGSWMREASADAEAWYNPLALVRAGLAGLDAAMQASSDTYRGLREAEADHADRLEREAAFLKKVSDQSGVNVTSLKQLNEMVAAGTVVQNGATGAWEKGTTALKGLAQGLGVVDTEYARALQVMDAYDKRQETAAKTADEQAKVAIAAAKAAGDEAGALRLTADAREAAAKRAQEGLAPERAALKLAEDRIAALQKLGPVDEAAREAREKTLADLANEIETRRNALASAEAQADMARIEAQTARLAADAHGNQAAQLGELTARRDALTLAIQRAQAAQAAGAVSATALGEAERIARDTAEAYTAVLTGQAQGDLPALAAAAQSAQDNVDRLHDAMEQGGTADASLKDLRQQLVETTTRLADAARDAAAQQDRLIAADGRERSLAAARAEVQIAELERRRALATARGAESDAADLAIQIMRREQDLMAQAAAGKLREAEALRAKAEATRLAAEADGEYTDAEQEQVAQTQASAEAATIEADRIRVNIAVKGDAIAAAQDLADQQRRLADAFGQAGAAGVKSMDDARQAIRDTADGDELARLKDALRQVWESGTLAQEQYKAALDEIMAKQDELANKTKVAGSSLFDPATLERQFNGDRSAIADYVFQFAGTGTNAQAGGTDAIMAVYDQWKTAQFNARNAPQMPAAPDYNPATTGRLGHVTPLRTVRVELAHGGKTATLDLPDGQDRDLLDTLQRAALATA